MVLADLKGLAGQLGIKGTSGMRKGDLVAAIAARQNGAGAATPAQLARRTAGGAGRRFTGAINGSAGRRQHDSAGSDSGRRNGHAGVRHRGYRWAIWARRRGNAATRRAPRPQHGRHRQGGQGEARRRGRDGQRGPPTQPPRAPAGPGLNASDAASRIAASRSWPAGPGQPAGRDNRSDNRDNQQGRRQRRTTGRTTGRVRTAGATTSDGRGRRGRRYRDRRRGRGRDGSAAAAASGASPRSARTTCCVPVAGILDVLDNYAFVRTSGYLTGPNDVYVSLSQVRKYGLRRGDAVTGAVRAPREGEQQRQKYNPLVRLDTINGMEPEAGQAPPGVLQAHPAVPAGAAAAGDRAAHPDHPGHRPGDADRQGSAGADRVAAEGRQDDGAAGDRQRDHHATTPSAT